MRNEKSTTQDQNRGQSRLYNISGTDPVTGALLPDRSVTQAQWREEKLGKAGYVKPADLEDDTEVEPTPAEPVPTPAPTPIVE